MVYKVVVYLFIDLFNDSIRPIPISYQKRL